MPNNAYNQRKNDSSCNRIKEIIGKLQHLNFTVDVTSEDEVHTYNCYVASIKNWAENLSTLEVEEK